MDELNSLINPVEHQEKVLTLMKTYEILIGELYTAYAEKFVEHKDFWQKIAKEEEVHAYWIETLANQIGNKKVYFDESRFNIAPLNQCIDEISIRIAETKNEPLVMIEAVAASLSIENGMIERKFFEVFESDSPEIKKTFNMLRIATINHGKSVQGIWESERMKTNKSEQGFWQKLRNLFN